MVSQLGWSKNYHTHLKISTPGLEMRRLQFLPLFCHLMTYMKPLGSDLKYSLNGFLIQGPSILRCGGGGFQNFGI